MSDSRAPNPRRKDSSEASASQGPAAAPIINREAALARLCGDESLLRDLAKLFLADAPGLLREAESALADRDAATLQRAVHSLRGLAASFDGLPAMAAARELENLVRHEKLVGAEAALSSLQQEISRLTAILTDIVQDGEQRP